MTKKRKRLGLIFGGRSSEHDVSIASVKSILDVIDPDTYEIELIGITRQGEWVTGRSARKLLNGKMLRPRSFLFVPTKPRDGRLALLRTGKEVSLVERLEKLDVVFPVLHGPYGEDGTIQGLFEMAGIPYVGAGVAASSIAMDKILAKSIFNSHGLPITKGLYFLRKDWVTDRNTYVKVIRETIGFPCFVKPSNTGSSIGISKVHDADGLESALDRAAEFDRKLMVEKAVDAREIECSVLGNDNPMASLPGEIVPEREFYDYTAKYHDAGSKLIYPAQLPDDITGKIREMSVKAFKVLDCCGMARVDFLLDRKTNEITINEVNTIPGFTSISMYPKLWEISGIGYRELIDQLIDLALERFDDRARCKTTCTDL